LVICPTRHGTTRQVSQKEDAPVSVTERWLNSIEKPPPPVSTYWLLDLSAILPVRIHCIAAFPCYKLNDFFDNVECCFDIVAGVDGALVWTHKCVHTKARPHQQQCRSNRQHCRSNIRHCRKNRSTCSIRQCCLDIVAGVDGALVIIIIIITACLCLHKVQAAQQQTHL